MMTELTIGRAARAAGVGVETIRFYERTGLVARPPRPEAGFRTYEDEAVRRVRFIRQAQELGFSLREIAELLALRADPGTDCADVRLKAEAKLAEVNVKLERLAAIHAALERVVAACPGKGALWACSIIDEIESGGPPPQDGKGD